MIISFLNLIVFLFVTFFNMLRKNKPSFPFNIAIGTGSTYKKSVLLKNSVWNFFFQKSVYRCNGLFLDARELPLFTQGNIYMKEILLVIKDTNSDKASMACACLFLKTLLVLASTMQHTHINCYLKWWENKSNLPLLRTIQTI